jgi:hypothetical protein
MACSAILHIYFLRIHAIGYALQLWQWCASKLLLLLDALRLDIASLPVGHAASL